MSALEVVLALINALQLVALAWIAAWQARAAHEVRKVNGTIAKAIASASKRDPAALERKGVVESRPLDLA